MPAVRQKGVMETLANQSQQSLNKVQLQPSLSWSLLYQVAFAIAYHPKYSGLKYKSSPKFKANISQGHIYAC